QQLRRRVGRRVVSGAGRRKYAGQGAQGARAPARDGAALHQVGSGGGGSMMALARREFHLFQAAGRDFLYLVPSAAVFALDAPTSAVLRTISEGETERGPYPFSADQPPKKGDGPFSVTEDGVIQALAGGFDAETVRAAIAELLEVRAIGYVQQPPEQPVRMLPMMPFPLT